MPSRALTHRPVRRKQSLQALGQVGRLAYECVPLKSEYRAMSRKSYFTLDNILLNVIKEVTRHEIND